MSALLQDILASIPDDSTYAFTVRKLGDRFYTGFDEKFRMDVFATEDTMVTVWDGGTRTDTLPPDGYELVTYEVHEHLTDDDDRVFYAGDIDGVITFRLPKSMLNSTCQVDYLLLQEDDVVYISDVNSQSTEYDDYVFETLSNPFDGAVVYGVIPIRYWVQIGTRLYYLPEMYEPGAYWLEVGFRKEHPTVMGALDTIDSDEYRVHVERNKLTGITPKFASALHFYGKQKAGEYKVILPDMDNSSCSVLCIVPEILQGEEDKAAPAVAENAPVEVADRTAEDLADKILSYAGIECNDSDKVIKALEYALSVIEVEKVEDKVDDDLFAGFFTGNF